MQLLVFSIIIDRAGRDNNDNKYTEMKLCVKRVGV